MDAKATQDERREMRTAKSCGPDAPDAGVKFLRSKLLRDDGGKRARSPGRSRISRKTIARGRPDVSANPWFLTRVLTTLHTRLRVR